MDKQEYLRWIKHTRDDWIDEIPTSIVDSFSRPNNYKARHVWFQSVYNRAAFGIAQRFVDENGKAALKRLRNHLEATGLPHRLTTAEDINKANNVLDLIINFLENS